ncbi:MAG: hypothetical protein QG650_807 [Patescibacteria group bacterium]|nr:hypothetical protein [Patescibacteria group bacterium]
MAGFLAGIAIAPAYAAVNNLSGLAGEVRSVSANAARGETVEEKANNAGLSVIKSFKIVISALAVVFLVYAGIMMIVAGGAEESLTKHKRQIMYALIAFLFINIPGQLYSLFGPKSAVDISTSNTNPSFMAVQKTGSNIFVNFANWDGTIEGGVLMFVRVAVVGLAIFLFVLAGLKLVASGGKEEAIKEAKTRILYGVLGLIFLGVIEAWVRVAYSGDIPRGQGIFAQLSNLALFFAGPTAIFFLILGAYYYITSAGDEERAKKGKSIVINTFIATIILLASYTFLKDLADFRL